MGTGSFIRIPIEEIALFVMRNDEGCDLYSTYTTTCFLRNEICRPVRTIPLLQSNAELFIIHTTAAAAEHNGIFACIAAISPECRPEHFELKQN